MRIRTSPKFDSILFDRSPTNTNKHLRVPQAQITVLRTIGTHTALCRQPSNPIHNPNARRARHEGREGNEACTDSTRVDEPSIHICPFFVLRMTRDIEFDAVGNRRGDRENSVAMSLFSNKGASMATDRDHPTTRSPTLLISITTCRDRCSLAGKVGPRSRCLQGIPNSLTGPQHHPCIASSPVSTCSPLSYTFSSAGEISLHHNVVSESKMATMSEPMHPVILPRPAQDSRVLLKTDFTFFPASPLLQQFTSCLCTSMVYEVSAPGIEFLPTILFVIPGAIIAGGSSSIFGRYKSTHFLGFALMIIGVGLFSLLNAHSSQPNGSFSKVSMLWELELSSQYSLLQSKHR